MWIRLVLSAALAFYVGTNYGIEPGLMCAVAGALGFEAGQDWLFTTLEEDE